MEFGVTQLWGQMGLIAKLVVIVLGLMSLWSMGTLVERMIVYSQTKRQSLKFAGIVGGLLKQDDIKQAIEQAKLYKQGHLAKLVHAGATQYVQESQGNVLCSEDVLDATQRSIERALLATSADLKRGLGTLATIGSTAPFIGLMGTVVGIINAFKGMATTGSGGLGAVSAGIAEALVTTAIGLFVAIPAVWIYNAFTNRVERFQVEMANSASVLMDYFTRKQGKEG